MQISRIYSNKPDVFTPIDFNYGDKSNLLNVIFAEIKHPKDKTKDSHNLGKTTLVNLLDFLFLRSMGDHFLERHYERFQSFVFFCEISLSSGDFVTLKRSVENNTKISFMKHHEPAQNFSSVAEDEWTHVDVALERAINMLDAFLNLKVISPWNYRKGISYLLRTQEDYLDILQLDKFKKGKDVDWKPFVSHLFGFKHQLVKRKYELDLEIDTETKRRKDRQAEVQIKENDVSKLANQILIKQEEIATISERLDNFSFHEEEKRIAENLVKNIEKEISEINSILYNVRSDIAKIERSISKPIKFNLEDVQKIFSDAEIHLPDQLVKNYEDLVEFNKKLSSERNASLKKRLKELKSEKEQKEKQLAELDKKRSDHLKIIKNEDTFKKYKSLQNELSNLRANLTYLENQQEKLQTVSDITDRIETLKTERTQKIAEIKADISKNKTIQQQIALTFNGFVKRLLDLDGLFYVKQNKEGNIEFVIETQLPGSGGNPSGQSEGKSYKQLLCALFDLSMLKVYADLNFYHFVYHDGILEGLDNRKRLTFLEIVREVTSSKKIQYIFSAIDTDLPRDDDDNKIFFSDEEIVLKLHDDGPDGRLFKMSEF